MSIDVVIERINELSRKHKTVGLTEEEKVEREELRRKYIANFKRNFRQQLNNIKYVEDEDEGTVKH